MNEEPHSRHVLGKFHMRSCFSKIRILGFPQAILVITAKNISSCYLGKFQIFVPPEYKIVWVLETISSSKPCDVKSFVSKS